MKLKLKIAVAGLIVLLVAGVAVGQRFRGGGGRFRQAPQDEDAEGNPFSGKDGEFRLARVKYKTFGGAGSHGLFQPWWAVDYPYAEQHFFEALRRVTDIDVAD